MPSTPLSRVLVVMTVDQRGSRSGQDLVGALLADLPTGRAAGLHLPFERTAGDEVQGVMAEAGRAVDLAVDLAGTGSWSVGLGTGAVRHPLPSSTRAAAGPAFEAARRAVERAKSVPELVAVEAPDRDAAQDVETALQAVVAMRRRRSPAGHEVVALLTEGLSQTEAADRLGISKQAVSQRLQAAMWAHEMRLRRLAERLLVRAATCSDKSSG